ncbi:peptidoglycan-binding protein [Palleronia sediminis]|uniref:Peptidoglycan-binding protein n=2 Tax=Palleronia sediminis TaxID=2547833 RepID=A0A4R6A834_9RHOB|nr:peptidoglycan-binding protein [Palleronia sediminis]
MTRAAAAALFAVTLVPGAGGARAQEAPRVAAAAPGEVWLQIAARSGQEAALEDAAAFDETLDDVQSFRIGSTDFYAIVLGPFSPDEAAARRRELRAQGAIPADSFTNEGDSYSVAIYPPAPSEAAEVAAATIPAAEPEPVVEAEPEPAPVAEPEPEPEPLPEPEPDETPAEARQSESELTREERDALQIALQWAGFYQSRIDGAFGRGTRAAMRAWQDANGYEPTGILTTRQRAALIDSYNAVLDGIGVAPVTDRAAGITVDMPTDLVAFARHAPPFAHYDARREGDPFRVLLISQAGGREDLNALYNVMQTLEIVPPEGERELRAEGFTLVGRDGDIVSHTQAQLRNGHIKGFTLIWPEGDEDRRTRLLDRMRQSFAVDTDEVLTAAAAEPSEEQSVDLLAGLRIRSPEVTRSGFYVTRRGDIVTTADAVADCREITLDDAIEATVAARDEALGLALLTPGQALAPRAHARFALAAPLLGSEAILAGFSFGGMLGAPSLTYGEVSDMRGLDGDARLDRYTLDAQPGDAGGPVLDPAGNVLGALLSDPVEGRTLPQDVAFAADAEVVVAFLEANGITADTARSTGDPIARGLLETRATDMTVLVGCWR